MLSEKTTSFIACAVALYIMMVSISHGAYIHLDKNVPQFFLNAGLVIFSGALAFVLHVIVHELGHLIGGLITGYHFVFIQFFNIIIMRRNSSKTEIHTKPNALAGYNLLSPPTIKNGKMRFVFYIMGGCAANLLLSIMCIIATLCFKTPEAISLVLTTICSVGLYVFITNLLPTEYTYLYNDGALLLALHKHPSSISAFWSDLKISTALFNHEYLREMDMGWFIPYDKVNPVDHISFSHAVKTVMRLLDQNQPQIAQQTIEKLLAYQKYGSGLNLCELYCEYICCLMINKASISKLFNSNQAINHELFADYREKMNEKPSTLRSKYALTYHAYGDGAESDRALQEYQISLIDYTLGGVLEYEQTVLMMMRNAASSCNTKNSAIAQPITE